MADAPDSLLLDRELTIGARLVGVLLWRHACSQGEAFVFPSTSRLAKLSCQDPRSVRRQIQQLASRGHIEKARRETAGGARWGWVLRDQGGTDGSAKRTEQSALPVEPSGPSSPPCGPTGPLEISKKRTEQSAMRTDGSAEQPPPGPTSPPKRTDGSVQADRPVRRSYQEPTNEPLTTTTSTPSASHSGGSGLWHELDMLVRALEHRVGLRPVGRLAGQSLVGFDEACERYGWEYVRDVALWTAEQVARGNLDAKLWRFAFRGEGFEARREAFEDDKRKRARLAAEVAPTTDDGPRLDPNSMTAVLEGADFMRRAATQ